MKTATLAQRVWQDPVYFIAFGFGSGLMPVMPGTWGTLAGIPVYLLLVGLSPIVYLTMTLLAFLLGVYVSHCVSRDLGVDDYPGIVWDEVVGYLLTMFLAPEGVAWMVVGFVLFRIFDVWKPQPIRWIDQYVKGGLGVMLDDVLAAVLAWLGMRLLFWCFGSTI